jgi:hypothetical protein
MPAMISFGAFDRDKESIPLTTSAAFSDRPNLPQVAEANIAQAADVMEAGFQYNNENDDLNSTGR